jgi:hypothetical protein
MSYAIQVKQELNRIKPARACCRTAELAGIFRAVGTFHILAEQRFGLQASLGLSSTARTAVYLLKSFGLPVEIRLTEDKRLGLDHHFEIYMEGGSRLVQFLNETGVLSDDLLLSGKLPRRIISRACCRGSFLRGAFLAAGSVSAPGRASHLEIYSDNEVFLETVCEASAAAGVELKITRRHRRPAAYCKRFQSVRDLLISVGAHQAALEFEERSIISGVRAEANRKANFDQANAGRCSEAAARQIKAIQTLKETAAWNNLSDNLIQIAELRLEHQSDTIADLGRRSNPPLSKSAVNHRLRRLLAIADQAI